MTYGPGTVHRCYAYGRCSSPISTSATSAHGRGSSPSSCTASRRNRSCWSATSSTRSRLTDARSGTRTTHASLVRCWRSAAPEHASSTSPAITMRTSGCSRKCCTGRSRRLLRLPYWSIAEHLKLAISTSARYIERFETAAARHAASEGFDGIVCGHIHRARLQRLEGSLYCNTGDWVDSCSALVEDSKGQLHLLRWPGIALPATRVGALHDSVTIAA
jgi:hypothetical protein